MSLIPATAMSDDHRVAQSIRWSLLWNIWNQLPPEKSRLEENPSDFKRPQIYAVCLPILPEKPTSGQQKWIESLPTYKHVQTD